MNQRHRSSALEAFQGHVFALLFDLTLNLNETFLESLMIHVVFCVEFLLLLFAPWVEFPFHDERIGKLFKALFYVFVVMYLVIAVSLALLYFLRAHRRHFLYEWVLGLVQGFYKWVFFPFFIPLFAQCVLIFKCRWSGDSFVHGFFPDVQCFTYPHIQHFVISVFAVVFHLVSTLVILGICYEHRKIQTCSTARHSTYLLIRTLFFIMGFMLLWCLTDSVAVFVFYASVFSAYEFHCFWKGMEAYYNPNMEFLSKVLHGFQTWSLLIPAISLLTSSLDQRGTLVFWLLGAPLAIYILWSMRTSYISRLKREEIVSKPKLAISYVTNLLRRLYSNKRESSVVLRGLAVTAPNAYPEMLSQMNKLSAASKKSDKQFFSASRKHFLSQINAIFSQCIVKNPEDVPLRLEYVRFLLEDLKNKQQSLEELNLISLETASFSEQFQVYRYKRLIKDEIFHGEDKERSVTHGFGKAMEYEKLFMQLKKKMEKAAVFKMEFTAMLLEINPDCQSLYRTGIRILSKQTKVEKTWEFLQELRQDDIDALTLYGQYHLLVNYDHETWKLLQKKAKECLDLHIFSANATDLKTYSHANSSFVPTIQISGNEERVGIILSCNAAFCKLFGYSKDELIGKSVGILMPSSIAKKHNETVLGFMKENEASQASFEKQVIALHKNRYIFPAWLKISTYPDLADGSILVGTVEAERSFMSGMVTNVLLNTKNHVLNVSSNAINTLKISNEVFSLTKINFCDLAPDIFTDGIINSSFYKEGGTVKYYYPDYSSLRGKLNYYNDLVSPMQSDDNKQETTERLDKYTEFHCKATEINMRGIGKVGTLLSLQAINSTHKGNISTNVKLNKESVNSIFTYDPNYNMYVYSYETSASPFHKPQEGRRYSGSIVPEDFSQAVPSNNPAIAKQDSMKKYGFYNLLWNTYKIEINKEHYGVLATVLLKKCEEFYGTGIVTYRLIPGGEVENAVEERIAAKLKAYEPENSEKRKLLDVGTDKLDIDNRKSLEASMQKFLSLRWIYLLALGIILTASTIITLLVLEFVFFDTQYKLLIEAVKNSKQYSRILPAFLYSYQNLMDLAACKRADNSIELCKANSVNMGLEEKQNEIGDYINELFEIQKVVAFSAGENVGDVPLNYVVHDIVVNETLSNAIELMITSLHNIKEQETIDPLHEDVLFVLANIVNNFGVKLSLSSQKTLDKLASLANLGVTVFILSILLFILPALSAIGLVLVLKTIYGHIQEILGLFLEVPEPACKLMNQQCEKFARMIAKEKETHNSSKGSIDGEEPFSAVDLEGIPETAKDKRQFKNKSWWDLKLLVSYLCFAVVTEGLILADYILFDSAIKEIREITGELSGTSKVEETTIKILITEFLLLQGQSEQTWTKNSQDAFLDQINDIYALDKVIEEIYTDKECITQDTCREIGRIVKGDLCAIYYNESGQVTCESLGNGNAKHGLGSALYHFYESVRRIFTKFQQGKGIDWKELFSMREIQKKLIRNGVRQIVNALDNIVSTLYYDCKSQRTTILIIFIAFVIVSCVVLFIPYLLDLKKSVLFLYVPWRI